jgi:hypothetical protein
MKVIAYLLYGGKREYQLELFFSMISAMRYLQAQPEPIKIVILGDRVSFAPFDPDFPAEQLLISDAELNEWTRDRTYFHRLKIFALLKALDHYQAPVALVDTDTLFLDHPMRLFERISPQRSVMHRLETNFQMQADPFWQPIAEHIGAGITIAGIPITPETAAFNSGVIGVDPTNRAALEKAIPILDQLYAITPAFDVEQFSVTAALNQFTEVVASDDVVQHYCTYEKEFMRLQIAEVIPDFSTATFNQQVATNAEITPTYPPQQRRDRLIARFLSSARCWNDDYRFAYLAYRNALANALKDSPRANIWARIALQQVKLSLIRYKSERAPAECFAMIQRDFRQFDRSSIDSLPWLETAIKQKWLQFWEELSPQAHRQNYSNSTSFPVNLSR